MSAPHLILELRTGRDTAYTPQAASQFLATLPKLKNQIWDTWFNQDEQLSLEILVQNQTIYFALYCPVRLKDYLKSTLTACYPQVMITEVESDPFLFFYPSIQNHTSSFYQPRYLELGWVGLTKKPSFPLKTFQDFRDLDPLITLLSNLANSWPQDLICLQFLIKEVYQALPSSVLDLNLLGSVASALTASSDSPASSIATEPVNSQKSNALCLKTALKIAVATDHQERSRLVLETIGTTFNATTQSQGNSLQLHRVLLGKKSFLNQMRHRQFSWWQTNFLSVDELATLYHLPNQQSSVVPNIAWGKNLPGEPPADLPIVDSQTSDDEKNQINVFAQTTYKNSTVKYGLHRIDRRRHLYAIGKTGTGKSTLLANMAINDLKKGEGMAVIDPHGDLIETLLDYIPSSRINDVVYFDPADQSDRIVKINLFEGENIVHRELIASGIISIFHKLYGYSWGPRLEYILRNSLLTLLSTPNARLSDVIQILTDQKFRLQIINKLTDPILKDYWLNDFEQMQPRFRTESIASILNKIGQFVSSPMIRNVVNAKKSSFSIEKLMSEGKILLANLSQGKLGEDNATLLGAMLITKIQLAAMARVNQEENTRRDFFLYVDEFQNFATESFIKILSEARKYRLNLTLANQYIAQIPEEVQKAIFGNCGNIVSFVMGADDAQAFTREYGGIYSPEDLVSLSRYQIINKISINNVLSRPFPAYTLPLLENTNQNRTKVINVSRERYAKTE